MRSAFLFSLLICGSAFAAKDADHHERKFAPATPVETTAAGAVYGARLPATMPAAVDLDTAAAHLEDHAGKPAAFSGRITEVCQKMGCWVVLSSEQGTLARVNMRACVWRAEGRQRRHRLRHDKQENRQCRGNRTSEEGRSQRARRRRAAD
jgi:hypothetical protein